jgi:hypothetical protein
MRVNRTLVRHDAVDKWFIVVRHGRTKHPNCATYDIRKRIGDK